MSASAPLVLEESSTPEHHIVAQGSSDGHHAYTLKHGDTFLVFDRRGDLGLEPGSAEGLYHRDTRILSRFELLLQDARPLLLSSTNRDDHSTFAAGLSNPDVLVDGQIVLRREQLQLQRLRFVWKGALHERLLLRNYS